MINLKEELDGVTFTLGRMASIMPQVVEICTRKDAERISESYAKEKAWEAWKYLAELADLEYDASGERTTFDKWWEEHK